MACCLLTPNFSSSPPRFVSEDDALPVLSKGEDLRTLELFIRLLDTIGLAASIYLPAKGESVIESSCIIRKKRHSPIVECEIERDAKRKRLRFSIESVTEVKSGKGPSGIVPTRVDDTLCLYIMIVGKGELNLIMPSVETRNECVLGFENLMQFLET